ncbi:MAG: hypothetical protein KBI01_02545 [Oscillospiraceae bacterium]|nr:hypothetical protein [Oscillospiraceae bacterium]
MCKNNCFIIALVLALLCSCSPAGFSSALDTPYSSPPDYSSSTAPLTSQVEAALVENISRAKIFRDFLSDNYNALSKAFYEGIKGIGFIDLDQDGGIEMLLFDAGASAAMGLQFFDIIDDRVECVSANLDSVRTAFGGKHMTDVVANANSFQDFRLMQEKESDKLFFLVESGNGAPDFIYREFIRFSNTDGVLSLERLLYKYTEMDIDSGAVTSQSYEVNGKTASSDEYSFSKSRLASSIFDTDYAAEGVFLWEGNYSSDLDGLMAMTDEALLRVGIHFGS